MSTKRKAGETLATQMMNELYWYGGEQWTLGAIIADLQLIAPNQACVDRYLQGLKKVQGV